MALEESVALLHQGDLARELSQIGLDPRVLQLKRPLKALKSLKIALKVKMLGLAWQLSPPETVDSAAQAPRSGQWHGEAAQASHGRGRSDLDFRTIENSIGNSTRTLYYINSYYKYIYYIILYTVIYIYQ